MELKKSAKNYAQKTNGSISGYTNDQTMSQFSVDKLWNEFVSELPFLVQTLKVKCKDYTDETENDVKEKTVFYVFCSTGCKMVSFVTFSKN